MKKEGYYYISESGITTLNDVKNCKSSGIDGLLVGGALMNSNNISSLLPSLKLNKENEYTKILWFKTKSDILKANSLEHRYDRFYSLSKK